jgi:uncharacterized protein
MAASFVAMNTVYSEVYDAPAEEAQHVGGDPAAAKAEYDRTGRISWVTDLAEIPGKLGVKNVYADLGQLFAFSTVVQPWFCAALMGTLIRGMGVDHVIWGTDAVWTGSPQWQIEGLKRLEIPADMQKQHGFKPLGAADGPVKTAIFGANVAKVRTSPSCTIIQVQAFLGKQDHFAEIKADYLRSGPERSNLRYGYVVKSDPA